MPSITPETDFIVRGSLYIMAATNVDMIVEPPLTNANSIAGLTVLVHIVAS